MLTNDPHHIIAIGASAGGAEEINTFFDHTPLDGVAYIVVQHLSADFKSRMVELLARHSKLGVLEAEEGIKVKCNKVYLIPNDKYMTINKGRLYLTDKESLKTPHLTINYFFRSLAADCGKKAIGVVLSGLGADGSEGVKDIKDAGGMAMARIPETSQYPSMPSQAIATGMIDFVLEPALMPGAIEEFVKHEGELAIEIRDDENNLASIIDLIKERSPLDFSDYRQSTILRRTKRRAANHNFSTLAAYLGFLKTDPIELEELSKDFLISVTAFFRDPKAFDFIQKNVIPEILERLTPNEELKLWVTGCATGEEVYSLAILIDELLTSGREHVVVKIFATDIDSAALAKAGLGVYPRDTMKNVSAERLKKYFTAEGDNYRVKPGIRKMAIFARHDLIKNPPYCNMQFISCRNLLIYMTPVLQRKVFNMLLFGLKMDGYLFLGSSENPLPIVGNLEIVNKQYKLYKNIKSKPLVSFDAFSMPDLLNVKQLSSSFSDEGISRPTSDSLAEAMHESLSSDLDYVAICIDENNSVIKSYGDTTKYLVQKNFTSDLAKLLPKELAASFNTLRNRVLKTNERLAVKGIKIKTGAITNSVNLTITPLTFKKDDGALLMVTFSDDKSPKASSAKNIGFDEKIYHDQYTLNLEDELKVLRDKLNSVYEQLNASNENMQSFNEEMISANEEMQSTNEEMQSVNEELDTINYEYQLKNKELLELNDDLNNYFRSNINGQLFIDKDLRLMKFSPGTVKQINLLESDIGRPISNITTNIKFETILDDIKKVLSDGAVITKEIETNNGKWYQVMTMPYVQQSDHKNNGAIITFNDITELKRIQQELDHSSKLLNMAITASGIATWSMNFETKEFNPSARLKEIFGFYPEDQVSYEAAVGQIVEEHQLIVTKAVEMSRNKGEKYDIEYPLKGFHDGKTRWVRAIGNFSKNLDGNLSYFTGVLHDITVLKQDELRKNDFIAMVSHELKSPLSSLQGYTQLLLARAKKSEDDFTLGLLNRSYAKVKEMNVMINGFLNVSSFEAGKIYLNEQTFEMDGLIEDIIEEVLLTSTSHSIVMQSGVHLSVKADRSKIGQVINNLLSNAIKYSPGGKTIEVSCKKVKGQIQISVKDEGMGIKTQDQEKLFDRYYRVDNGHTKAVSGFGLGLYLSAEIIQRHNGKLEVKSEIGKGSTFFFSLPIAS